MYSDTLQSIDMLPLYTIVINKVRHSTRATLQQYLHVSGCAEYVLHYYHIIHKNKNSLDLKNNGRGTYVL